MKPTATILRALAASTSVLLLASACADSAGGEAGDVPASRTEFVTAGDPGGGLDIFAREIKQSMEVEELTDTQLDITNLGGGGGNSAMAVGRARNGQGDTLIGNSNRVYLNPLIGITDLEVGTDFVPIAQIMTEYVVLAVREDSPYQSAEDLVEALQGDPRAASLGVGTIPSDDQLHLLRLGEEIGIEPGDMNIVAFSAGGDLMTQLLGGQVDVVSTGLSEALPQYEAGEVRLLAISAPERVEGPAAEVPTWEELGIDLVVDHWRGVFGPADMPAESVAYWEDKLAEMVETDAWQEVLDRNQWTTLYRDGDEFAEVLEQETADAQRLLEEVGLVEG